MIIKSFNRMPSFIGLFLGIAIFFSAIQLWKLTFGGYLRFNDFSHVCKVAAVREFSPDGSKVVWSALLNAQHMRRGNNFFSTAVLRDWPVEIVVQSSNSEVEKYYRRCRYDNSRGLAVLY